MEQSLSDIVPFLIMLAVASLFVPIFHRLHVSPILAYLITGVIIGPSCLALVPPSGVTDSIAELGLVFLMFSIGLELSFARLIVMRRVLLTLGPMQLVLTSSFIGLIAYALGISPLSAGIIGTALALSSTAMVTQLLIERGEWQSPSGRTAFAMLIFQDLAMVPLIILLPLLEHSQSIATIIQALGWALLQALGALIIVTLSGRILARPLLGFVANQGSEASTLVIFTVILGTGWLASFLGGLSMALGAFLGGLAIAETEFKHQVHHSLQPVRDVLVGLFFIAMGMRISIDQLTHPWFIVIGLALGLMAIKAIILALAANILGFNQGKRMGLLLAQGGEFSFILLQIADALQLILPKDHHMISTLIVLSMILTPVFVSLNHSLQSYRSRSQHPKTPFLHPIAKYQQPAPRHQQHKQTYPHADPNRGPLTSMIKAVINKNRHLFTSFQTLGHQHAAIKHPANNAIRQDKIIINHTAINNNTPFAKGEPNMHYYWVIGGRYRDRSFTSLAHHHQQERLGPYPHYQQALAIWAERAWASADDALARWQIIQETPPSHSD